MSLIQTPSGRLITASCRPGDRTAFFSANFALSHGCWFFAYLLAGHLGSAYGLIITFTVLALLVLLATAMAQRIWPLEINAELEHSHHAIEHEHAHVHYEHHQHEHAGEDEPVIAGVPHVHRHYHPEARHSHLFMIDLHHPHWLD